MTRFKTHNYEGVSEFFLGGLARWSMSSEVPESGKANRDALWTGPGMGWDSWLRNFYPLSANLSVWARTSAEP